MSDSSLSSAIPSHVILEQALRDAVQLVYKNGNLEDLTIKRMRTAAEQDLNLEEGFFKNDTKWKDESKSIIQSEVEAHAEGDSIGEPSNSQASPKVKAPSKFSKTQETTAQKKGVKRASQGGIEPKKKRGKTQSSKDKTTDNNHNEEAIRSKANNKGTDTKAPTASSEKKQVDHPKEETADSISPDPMVNEITVPGSDSEMSVLVDEEPKSKSNGRSSGARKPSTKKNTGSKTAKRTEEPVDPDAEEIKRLQGWLTKCGIRKMWYKELAPYKTPKEKIHHLKNMLSDAGMTGRYSAEKAAQIRDERELKADLEAVQEGDRHWGKVNSEEEEPSKPRRRLARGLKELDFLNDDDGEETD